MLDKKAILASADIKTHEVAVPEWGGSVYVAEMDVATRMAFQSLITNEDGKPKRLELHKLLVLAVCDKDGNPEFTQEDEPALAKKSFKPVDRILSTWMRVNGLSAESVKDIEKN